MNRVPRGASISLIRTTSLTSKPLVSAAASRCGHANSDGVASITGHLLWHGVDPDVALELVLCWNRIRCRPPLGDVEVARTVPSIIRLHERHEEGE